MDAAEIMFWNQRSYGTAIRLRRSWLIAASSILCMLTPATNWILPFLGRLIPRDMMLRYERYPDRYPHTRKGSSIRPQY